MTEHYHINLETFAATGLMVLVFLNVWKIGAAWGVKSNMPILQHLGRAGGALINFGG